MNAPEPLPQQFCALSDHRYRVTIEHLYTPHAGEALDAPLVFETTHQDSLVLLFIAERLRMQAPSRRHGSTRPI